MRRAMQQIVEDVRKGSAPEWFTPDSMRFFGTRIENYPVSRANDRNNRRFFITSEDNYDGSERVFSVRYATTDPSTNDTVIETFGEFGQYEDMGSAISAIVNMFDLALDIGWDAVVDIEDLR